jgi:RNA polymerase sigma factor (sigma-70 family)
MTNRSLDSLLHNLRARLSNSASAELTDRQLLEDFSTLRDSAALTRVVARHGPMVLGVCRRWLSCEIDAEDAFQATFLVLARKAGALPWREMVGGWLHTMATHIARDARRRVLRNNLAPLPEEGIAQDGSEDSLTRSDLRRVLDEELSQLPAKLRDPLVLCYLQGKTHEEAAREIGLPRGSLAKRLAGAQELLRKRLTSRGIVLTAGLLATAVAENASAAVPAALTAATVKVATLFVAVEALAAVAFSGTATALAEGAIKAMFATKIKTATAALLAVSLVGVSAGVVVHGAGGDQRTGDPTAPGMLVASAYEKSTKKTEKKESPATEPTEIDKLIAALDDKDFATRERAMKQLLEKGKKIVPALVEALKNTKSVEQKKRLETLVGKLDPPKESMDEKIARLISNLGSNDITERDKATNGLVKIGKPAVPALREVLQLEKATSLEVVIRVEKVLKMIEGK